MQLGLKASTNEQQIEERLSHAPAVFEFYLTEADFTPEGWAHFDQMVQKVQATEASVVFHQPMSWHNQRPELCVNPWKHPALAEFVMQNAQQLIAYAKQVGARALIHGGYNLRPGDPDYIADWPSLAKAQSVVLGRMLQLVAEAPESVVFENSLLPVFAFGEPEFEAQLVDLQLPLAYDVSHAFISVHGDNDKLVRSLAHLRNQIRHYHLVDSLGVHHDSLPLGQGDIDWQRVVPQLNPQATSIMEINLANQNDSREMLESAVYLDAVIARLQGH